MLVVALSRGGCAKSYPHRYSNPEQSWPWRVAVPTALSPLYGYINIPTYRACHWKEDIPVCSDDSLVSKAPANVSVGFVFGAFLVPNLLVSDVLKLFCESLF